METLEVTKKRKPVVKFSKQVETLLEKDNVKKLREFVDSKIKFHGWIWHFQELLTTTFRLLSGLDYKHAPIKGAKPHSDPEQRSEEYGYYCSHNIWELVWIIDKLKIQTYVELGSGLGFFMATLRQGLIREASLKSLTLIGWENEPKFVEFCSKAYYSNFKIVEGDILNIKSDQFKGRTLIYYWQPFTDHRKGYPFVENLINQMTSSTILFVQCPVTESYINSVLSNDELFSQKYIYNQINGFTLLAKR